MNPKKYRPFPQYLPSEGQACYVVRYETGGAAIPAVFNSALWAFTSPITSFAIDAWTVVEWRPNISP
jgi:hypothetical protein